jgi:hypothetical protein
MAMSTVGVDASADMIVTVQRDWPANVGSFNSGVAPDWHTAGPASELMHSVVESAGEVATMDAVTAPGPSLVNVNVLAACVGLVAESSIKPLNVMDAIGDV